MGKPKGLPKTGGRPPGGVNKKTADLFAIADRIGVNPFEVLCMYANRDWKSLGFPSETVTKVLKDGGTIEVDRIEPDMQISAAKEACKYLFPQKRAMDVNLDPDEKGFKIILEDYRTKDK